MNPKLTNLALKCTAFVFSVNSTDFTGQNYNRIGRNTHHIYTGRNLPFKIVTVDYKLFKCFENLNIPNWWALLSAIYLQKGF